MALGTTVADTNVDFNQGAFAFYGLRRLSPAAELTFGLRVNTLQGELTFTGPDLPRNQDQTWVDPIVGVNLQTPTGPRLQLRFYTEVGGFGAGSDFTWQVFPDLSIHRQRWRRWSLAIDGWTWTTRQVKATSSSSTMR